ncbi:MAG: paraquat-inducible protein A [Pseudomonadota bacterium]
MRAESSPERDNLIACDKCDALYRVTKIEKGERAVCQRCHTVLIAPVQDAGLKLIAMALACLILVISTLFLPFLEIQRLGFSNETTLLDAARAFSGGFLGVLVVAVVLFMLGLPALRLAITIYTIAPLVFDRPALPHAKGLFALSERLRPWSMAEIFLIGCAVSLVKLGELARVEFGPAFWMFCVLVVLIVIQDTLMCRWSVWRALDR